MGAFLTPPLAAIAPLLPPFEPLPFAAALAAASFAAFFSFGLTVTGPKKDSSRPWLALPLAALIFLTWLRTRSSLKPFSPVHATQRKSKPAGVRQPE